MSEPERPVLADDELHAVSPKGSALFADGGRGVPECTGRQARDCQLARQ
jgi:hypothetical protein